MLVSLGFGTPTPPRTEQPAAFRLLNECHGRIRNHVGIARRLASPEALSAPTEQRVEAARALARYFGIALPLHVDDEDFSLAPRLQRPGHLDEDARRVQEMIAQHELIDAFLARLLPRWRTIANGEGLDAATVDLLAPDTEGLSALMAPHLELEERWLFPLAARVLRPEELDEIADEIRGRRGT